MAITGCVKTLVLCAVSTLPLGNALSEDGKTMRLGIIGLDTSHVPAFTKEFHKDPVADPALEGFRVVAAYPFGSADIESSASRIPKYTAEVRAMGVEVVDSIADLLSKVDAVLLETNDGRLHLEQALEVFQAGKPVFIDKPTGSRLAEVVAIYQAAEHYRAKVFSSSSLRFSPGHKRFAQENSVMSLGVMRIVPVLWSRHMLIFIGMGYTESSRCSHAWVKDVHRSRINPQRCRISGWNMGWWANRDFPRHPRRLERLRGQRIWCERHRCNRALWWLSAVGH